MTVSKPEVAAYHHVSKVDPEMRGVSLNYDPSCYNTLNVVEPLVRLSDYEALKAERDALAAHLERLNLHAENCANELVAMINRHNSQNMEDGSWDYDCQTPYDLMMVVRAAPETSLAKLKAERDELRKQLEAAEAANHNMARECRQLTDHLETRLEAAERERDELAEQLDRPRIRLIKENNGLKAERDECRDLADKWRADWHEATDQRDALAAAYKELDDLVSSEYGVSFGKSSPLAEAWSELTDPDFACLNRLIAQKQAEALVEFGYRYGPETEVRANSQKVADQLRRQAETESDG